MDPDTGKVYNILLDVMKDDVKRKLVKVEHTKEQIKNGFQVWQQNLSAMEDYFKEDLRVIDVTNRDIKETTEIL